MPLPPLAELAPLLIRVATDLSDEDTARAAALLDDVSAEVRDVTGRTWCDESGVLDPDRPAMLAVIVMRACERHTLNRHSLHSESFADYRRTWDSATSTKRVYLTSGEVDTLERIAGIEGILSVPTERDVTLSDTVWLSDQYGGDRIPWSTTT